MASPLLLSATSKGLFFGKKQALAPFSFEWKQGEHWGIIGPNGSGKTQFIKLISSTLYDFRTSVEYYFKPCKNKEPEDMVEVISLEKQRELVESLDIYVQMRWNNTIEEESTPTLEDWFSQDSVEGVYPTELVVRTKAEIQKFNKNKSEYIKLFKLEALMKQHIAELSNGELRRAFIARSLLFQPRILFLDAPFMGLDTATRELLTKNIDMLAEKHAIALATTTEAELPSCITHTIEFDASGRIVYCGVRRAIKKEKVKLNSFDNVSVSNAYQKLPSRASFAHRQPVDTTAKALVQFAGTTISYGDNHVFDNFSWTIREGERWALVGENGSGKTTLIALILGDHQQGYANKLTLFGKARGSGESIWDIKKKLGWVSPELHTCIDEKLSIFNVVLSGFSDTPYPTGRFTKTKKEAAIEMLKMLKINYTPDTAFGNLSGGEQRLVLLARALVKQPPLLVLDEPCQNLDKRNRELFLSILDEQCSSNGTALIFVTHLHGSMPKCISHKLTLKRETNQD